MTIAKKLWAKAEELDELLQQQKAALEEREKVTQMEIISRAADMADAKTKCQAAFIRQKGLENEYKAYESSTLPKRIKSKGIER